MNLLKRGLTSFDLKMIGITLMVLDHIHQMFYFVGAPDWFSMLGRLVAPIFLFLSAEGFHYTHSRKHYMMNLLVGFWICNISFTLIARLLPNPKVVLMNSIFGTLFLGLCFMWVLDGFFGKRKYPGKAVLGLLGLIALTILPLLLMSSLHLSGMSLSVLLTLLPSPMLVEGGPVFIITGGLLYLFREKRWAQYLVIIALSVLVFITNGKGDYQWLMVFSLIPIALYHGQQGKKDKLFFYIFYPVHILILYAISSLFFV